MASFRVYSRSTVNVPGADHTRRWLLAIAVVAALTLFVSLIAGSSLRSTFSAATLPEPAVWSQVTPNAPQPHSHSESRYHLQHASWGTSPTNTKPFHSMWMTHDRPDTWPRLQFPTLWSALPDSFAPIGFQSGRARTDAPAAESGDREILTLLCIARR
jgi:hypothetical protein